MSLECQLSEKTKFAQTLKLRSSKATGVSFSQQCQMSKRSRTQKKKETASSTIDKTQNDDLDTNTFNEDSAVEESMAEQTEMDMVYE